VTQPQKITNLKRPNPDVKSFSDVTPCSLVKFTVLPEELITPNIQGGRFSQIIKQNNSAYWLILRP
jgi:hypothetical protein